MSIERRTESGSPGRVGSFGGKFARLYAAGTAVAVAMTIPAMSTSRAVEPEGSTSRPAASAPAGNESNPDTRSQGTGLRVNVTDLPEGRRGNVTVTGKGVKRNLTSSTTLRNLAAGRYRIKAAPVAAKDGAWHHPTLSATIVRVRAGELATTEVSYFGIRSKETVIARGADIRSVVRRQQGSRIRYRVELRGTKYRRGSIVAAGITGKTPNGLLIRLTKAIRTRGGLTRFAARPAHLREAIQRGSLTTDGPIRLDSRGSDPHSWGWSAANSVDMTCTRGSAGVSADVSGSLNVVVNTQWDGIAP